MVQEYVRERDKFRKLNFTQNPRQIANMGTIPTNFKLFSPTKAVRKIGSLEWKLGRTLKANTNDQSNIPDTKTTSPIQLGGARKSMLVRRRALTPPGLPKLEVKIP